MLEILNSGAFASPIIAFVNQKKTADMVAKDLSRAGVGLLYKFLWYAADRRIVVGGHAAFWQDSGTARGFAAVITLWRGGHFSRD